MGLDDAVTAVGQAITALLDWVFQRDAQVNTPVEEANQEAMDQLKRTNTEEQIIAKAAAGDVNALAILQERAGHK